MGRRRANSPLGARLAAHRDTSEAGGKFSGRAMNFLSSLWLPVCFTGINAVCYAIDPAAAALMMASSTFLLHQMGVAGRHLTMMIIFIGGLALLIFGSDVLYILAVHTLYYLAVSLKSKTDAVIKSKKSIGRRGRPPSDHSSYGFWGWK